MKYKILLLGLLSVSLCFACTKEVIINNSNDTPSSENNNNENIVGTSWVTYWDSSHNEGATIRFDSDSHVTWIDWYMEEGYHESSVSNANYTYNAPNGSITGDGFSASFTIDGTTLTYKQAGQSIIFNKE